MPNYKPGDLVSFSFPKKAGTASNTDDDDYLVILLRPLATHNCWHVLFLKRKMGSDSTGNLVISDTYGSYSLLGRLE